MTDAVPDTRKPPEQDTVRAIRRDPLVAAVTRSLRERCVVTLPTRAVVAVSGGPDPTALLLVLAALRDRREAEGRIEPLAVHVNHHLRPEADAEAAHVEALCDTLGVPCRIAHLSLDADGPGLAEAARSGRYEALARVATEADIDLVATAHHAVDQLETILMALGRGAGLGGIAGMSWRRRLTDRVDIVRPLLDVDPAMLETLCRTAGVTWCDDPTNRDRTRPRTRLRHEVIPILESIWPGAAERVTGLGEQARLGSDLITRRVTDAFGPPSNRHWRRDDLAALPIALITAGLRRAATTLVPDVVDTLSRDHLRQVAAAIRDDDRRPRTWDWPGLLSVNVTAHDVRLERRNSDP